MKALLFLLYAFSAVYWAALGVTTWVGVHTPTRFSIGFACLVMAGLLATWAARQWDKR